MLTVLGKRPATGDAVDLLLECHDRIRSFLALARRVGEAGPADREAIPEAAARVHRYFTQALPLHARDEEDSILPRLAGRDPEVDRELATMRREHAEHEPPMTRLVQACDEVARDLARHAALAPVIGDAARELEAHFVAHLRREEEIIFPAMRRLLQPADDAAIVRELRARRGVVDPAAAAPPSSP